MTSVPHSGATVAGGFVSGMLAGVPNAKRLLLDYNLPPVLLTDPSARLPLAEYAALYNQIVRRLDDEGFGLFSGPLRLGTFEFLCRAMVGEGTLKDALARAAAFLRLVLPDLALTTSAGAFEIAETRRIAPLPARIFAFEWLLRLIHALSCWVAGRALALDSVEFPYARPAHADDYALIYTEQPSFGGSKLVARLNPALLALPVVRDADDVAGFLDGAPGKIAILYRRDHEMVRQVREVLLTQIADPPGLEDIARRLQLSLRTVQRRLRQEGASYRAIKAAVRRDLALARLEQSARPVAQIAQELGYSEPSAFFRAVVGWTGEAPSTYRKRTRS